MAFATFLRLAPWAIAAMGIVLGGGFGLIERGNYLEEKAARAEDRAAAEKALNEAMESDARHARELEEQHAAEVAKLKEQANAREVSIALAPNSRVCLGSEPMRALFDGLRSRANAASAGQPQPAGRTREIVPR